MTETIELRDGVSGDRDAVLELRRRAFPESTADMLRADFWNWKFLQGYAGEAKSLAAVAGDRIVAYIALVPQRYASPAPFTGGLTVDVMTDPEYRGRRIYSRLIAAAAERFRNDFDTYTAFTIRPRVFNRAVASGWLPMMRVPVLVRPLSMRGMFRLAGFPIESRPLEAARDESIRRFSGEDLAQIEAVARVAAVHQPRTVPFLRWRYIDSPVWRYELEGYFKGNSLRAFIVHRETELRGVPTLAIVDAGFLPGEQESLRRLIRHVMRQGRRRALPIVAALLTRDHPVYPVLRRRGFFPGPHRFNFHLQVCNDSLEWIRDRPWVLSWGDSDHL